MPTWPSWWDWELEFSAHLFTRMVDRDFNELAVPRMLTIATSFRPDVVPDRWTISTRHRRAPWEVIVEPDSAVQLLVVVTAYPVER